MAAFFTAPELDFTFVQNPKAGCSSVKEALWQALDERRGVVTYGGVPHQRPGPWQDCTAEAALAKETIAVVRNPFARAYSAYSNKIYHPPGQATVSDMKRRHWSSLGLAGDPGFPAFVRLVESQAGGAMDPHWAPQHRVLAARIDRLFRLEDAPALSAYLVAHIGRPLGHWRQAGTGVAAQAAYDADTADRVRRIYAEDFTRYGYGPDLP